MSQANWPALKILYLSKHIQNVGDNKVSDEGCHHLSQANWPALKILDIGKHI